MRIEAVLSQLRIESGQSWADSFVLLRVERGITSGFN
jgi:hypothetical protein